MTKMKSKINDLNIPEVFPTNSSPYGQSYEQWTVEWWNWAFSIPKYINPLMDNSGQHCAEGQGGPVWYLAGTTGNTHFAERSCHVPRGKSILFPILASQFSFFELPSAKIVQDLRRHAAKGLDKSFLEATIDGTKLQNLNKYRIMSEFQLILESENIWDLKEGITTAVSDGFWVFLKPLGKGNHTISFQGIEPHFETRVNYHLMVE